MPFDLSTAKPVSSGFDLSTAKPVTAPAAAPNAEGMPTGREVDNSAAQWLGVVNRALAPYATAAGVGAAVGAPVGGVGAIPGAAMGVTALGLGDVGTSLYNLGAGYFGGQKAPLPSETIQNAYEAVGIGRKPATTAQELVSAGVSGAAGGFAPARAFNELAPLIANPTTRGVVTELSQQPVAQAAVGAGAAMAPELAQAAGVEDPRLLALSSVVGGLAGAKTAGALGRRIQTAESTAKRAYDAITNAPTSTTEELKTAASNAYRKADASGITFTPSSYSNMVSDVQATLKKEGFDPDLSDRVAKAIGVMEKRQGAPQSLTDIDNLRKIVSQLKTDADPNTRRLAGTIVDKIDDYVTKSGSNAISTGTPEGIAALNEGRSMWARMSKSNVIEDILDKADLSSTNAADTIKNRFAALARSDSKMRRFNSAEKEAIRNIGEGNATPTTLNIISKLAPGMDLKGIIIGGALATGAYSEGISPEEAAAFGLVGMGARGARNYLAKRNVSNLAAGIRRGDVQAPYNVPSNALVSPITQQVINSLANQTGR